MCIVLCVSQQELSTLWCELQRDRPEMLTFLEGILVHAVSHLQDTIKERDNLEQALRRLHLPSNSLILNSLTMSVSILLSLYNFFPTLLFFSALDERANMIRLFGLYTRKWKVKSKRRKRDSWLRYIYVLVSPTLVLEVLFKLAFNQIIVKSRTVLNRRRMGKNLRRSWGCVTRSWRIHWENRKRWASKLYSCHLCKASYFDVNSFCLCSQLEARMQQLSSEQANIKEQNHQLRSINMQLQEQVDGSREQLQAVLSQLNMLQISAEQEQAAKQRWLFSRSRRMPQRHDVIKPTVSACGIAEMLRLIFQFQFSFIYIGPIHNNSHIKVL